MFRKVIKYIPSTILFGEDESRFKWNTFDDHLIGGRSLSLMEQRESVIKYSGTIKNLNNSSWSCLRSNKLDQDISGYKGLKIKLKPDKNTYSFQMEYNQGWQDEKCSCLIQAIPDQWNVVDLKFENFQHIQFGKNLKQDLNPSVLNHILRYNFYVTRKSTGSFNLEIEYIQFY